MTDDNFFSDDEISLLFNKEIFYTKRSATEKLYLLFSEIIAVIKDTPIHKSFLFPDGTDFSTGKISKGENYKGSPYVMLDFPKLFSKDSIFAFRAMFWFGHGFVFSIVVAGNALKPLQKKFLKNKNGLHHHNIYFSIFNHAWQHEIHKDANILVEEISTQEMEHHINKNHFIKLSSTSLEVQKEKLKNDVLKNYELMLGSFL
ncbi:MAG: hypothetical protein ACKVPJ_02205 [Chitinophagales bacterium]